MTESQIVASIATAIERQEGYKPGTRAWRNNNPGNIWDDLCPGKTHRIWPQYPIDDGFLTLPDYATGRRMMEDQIRIKIHRGRTLRRLLNEWDSSDPQPTRDIYVAHVAEWTGLPTDVALNTL